MTASEEFTQKVAHMMSLRFHLQWFECPGRKDGKDLPNRWVTESASDNATAVTSTLRTRGFAYSPVEGFRVLDTQTGEAFEAGTFADRYPG